MFVARDAEVHDGGPFRSAGGIVQVRRLDVAMEDALAVHHRKSVRVARERAENICPVQRRSLGRADGVAKRIARHALQKSHDEKGLLRSRIAHDEEIHQLHEAGVAESRHDARLAMETRRVGGLEQVLHRHVLARGKQPGLEHLTESAFTDEAQQTVDLSTMVDVHEAHAIQTLQELDK